MPKLLDDYVVPEYSGKDYDLSKPIDEKRINSYVAECIQTYESYSDLEEKDFMADFSGWTRSHFEAINRALRKRLYRKLESHGLHGKVNA
ncbi:hypothetical protein Hte_004574 [Hypoxylon texense]